MKYNKKNILQISSTFLFNKKIIFVVVYQQLVIQQSQMVLPLTSNQIFFPYTFNFVLLDFLHSVPN